MALAKTDVNRDENVIPVISTRIKVARWLKYDLIYYMLLITGGYSHKILSPNKKPRQCAKILSGCIIITLIVANIWVDSFIPRRLSVDIITKCFYDLVYTTALIEPWIQEKKLLRAITSISSIKQKLSIQNNVRNEFPNSFLYSIIFISLLIGIQAVSTLPFSIYLFVCGTHMLFLTIYFSLILGELEYVIKGITKELHVLNVENETKRVNFTNSTIVIKIIEVRKLCSQVFDIGRGINGCFNLWLGSTLASNFINITLLVYKWLVLDYSTHQETIILTILWFMVFIFQTTLMTNSVQKVKNQVSNKNHTESNSSFRSILISS